MGACPRSTSSYASSSPPRSAASIGLEREIREHTAGFRTHILVSVGAAAFTIASSYGLEGTAFDPNRISAQIVTGIGFLGAGAIIRYGASVRGLTTAASLWTVAAVGLLAAQGFYAGRPHHHRRGDMSACTSSDLVEDKVLYPLAGHPVRVRVQFRSSGYIPLAQLMAALQEVHVVVKEMAVVPGENDGNTIHLSLRLPRRQEPARLLALIAELDDVRNVALD